MPIDRPFKRTCRQLMDGSYSNNGNWQYLLHKDFAEDPQHYVRGFIIIQKDLLNLFEFIEPCDQNLNTVSFRIHELLIRTCIEIEANFTAILRENIFSKKGNLTIHDYKIINRTHKLSSYKVGFPIWKGDKRILTPFEAWENSIPLKWYQAYNKSKHDRHQHFDKATFENLLNAVCGLVALLAAQFNTENYSPNEKGLSIGSSYSYGPNGNMKTAIGGYFRVKFPSDWPVEERYGFEWHSIAESINPVARINYDELK